MKIRDWYGKGPRFVEIVSANCAWYHAGMPVVPIRWVLVRHPKGERARSAAAGLSPVAHLLGTLLLWVLLRCGRRAYATRARLIERLGLRQLVLGAEADGCGGLSTSHTAGPVARQVPAVRALAPPFASCPPLAVQAFAFFAVHGHISRDICHLSGSTIRCKVCLTNQSVTSAETAGSGLNGHASPLLSSGVALRLKTW